jgi:hypothetical protein
MQTVPLNCSADETHRDCACDQRRNKQRPPLPHWTLYQHVGGDRQDRGEREDDRHDEHVIVEL